MSTKIEWCEETWNPITGCSPVSEGCDHCYARRMAQRLKGRYGYPSDEPFRVTFHPDRLDQPLKWKKPRMIFVCSMGDLFHKDIADDQINSVFLMMLHFDWHTYLILTKRPERMADFISIGTGWRGRLPHVYLGVTAETQQRADERIPILLQIPAAKHFVSVEPMLGPVDINPFLFWEWTLRGHDHTTEKTTGLDWVIVGGESGPGARPMHPAWPRLVRDQCQEAGVPFFFKQHGKWKPVDEKGFAFNPKTGSVTKVMLDDQAFEKVGKKVAGRLLDGREWNERPQ